MNDFATRLLYALRTRGLSQRELADKLRVTPTAVSGYCKGRYTPNVNTTRAICAALHISEEWLRTGAGDMDAPLDDVAQFIQDFNPSEAELKMFQIFTTLPDESKSAVIDMLKAMGKALEEMAEQQEEKPAPDVLAKPMLKIKGEPVPPPAGDDINKEFAPTEFGYLKEAAAHDIDGVSPYIPEGSDDDDSDPA